MISLDSLPEALGGDPTRARQHFDRAVALQKGQSPGPYVALATGVAVPARNRAEFESLLKQALAVDPERGSVECASRRSSPSGVRARCWIKSTPGSCNSAFVKEFRMSCQVFVKRTVLVCSSFAGRARRAPAGRPGAGHHPARDRSTRELGVAQGAARHGRRVEREDQRAASG